MLSKQPMSIKNDNPSIQHLVAKEILERAEDGKQKYDTYLQAFNGRDSNRDLIEELLDAVCYSYQVKLEKLWTLEQIKKLYATVVGKEYLEKEKVVEVVSLVKLILEKNNV